MAILNVQDRVEVWAEFMQRLAGDTGLTKGNIKEAVDAVDAWLDGADETIVQALPEPAASGLTVEQRRQLFMLVLLRRHERQA